MPAPIKPLAPASDLEYRDSPDNPFPYKSRAWYQRERDIKFAEMQKQVQATPAEEGGGASSEQIKEFAKQQGMTETEAATILQEYTQNRTAPKFQQLSSSENAALEAAVTPIQTIRPENTVAVGINTGNTEYIARDKYEQIEKELGSVAANVLKEKGTEAFNRLQQQFVEGAKAQVRETKARLSDFIENNEVNLVAAYDAGFTQLKDYAGFDVTQNDLNDAAEIARENKQSLVEWNKFNSGNIILGEKAMPIDAWNKLPEKYQSIAIQNNSFDAMENAIETDNAKYDALMAKLNKSEYQVFDTKDFSNNRPVGYDIAKYLRDNPNSEQQLMDVLGATDQEIAQAKEYNMKYLGIGAPEYISRSEFVSQYLQNKGLSPNQVKILTTTPAKSPEVIEANQAYDARYTAPIDLQTYVENYISEKGWKPVDTEILPYLYGRITGKVTSTDAAHVKEATAEYTRKFGVENVVGSGAGEILPLVYAPARALKPDVKWNDISTAEQLIGVGQVLTVGAAAVGGLGLAGAASAKAMTGGALGIFTYQTVKDWDNMDSSSKAIAVAVDTLLALSLVPRVKLTTRMKETETKAGNVIDKVAGTEAKESLAYDVGKARMEQALKEAEIYLKTETPKISRAEAQSLYRQAGLSEAAIKELTQPKFLKVTKDVAQSIIERTKSEYAKMIDARMKEAMAEIERTLSKEVPTRITKQEAETLYREAGLSEAAIRELTKPKYLRITERQINNIIQNAKQTAVRGYNSYNQYATAKAQELIARYKPVEANAALSRRARINLFRSAGFSEEAISDLMKPQLLRQSQRLAESIARNVKSQYDKFVEARMLEAMRKIDELTPEEKIAKLSKKEVAELYRQAGLSEAAINELLKPRLLRVSQRLAASTAEDIAKIAGKAYDDFISSQTARAMRELDRYKIAEPKAQVSKAEAIRLYKEAGLSDAAIKRLVQPKLLRVSGDAIRSVAGKIKSEYQQFIEAQIQKGMAEAQRYMIKEQAPKISKAEAIRLYREAGLSDAAISELTKPKYLRMSQRAIEDVINKAKKAYKQNVADFERGINDAIKQSGIKITEAKIFTSEMQNFMDTLRLGNVKQIKAAAKRLELAAGKLPPKLAEVVKKRIELLKEPEGWVKVAKKGGVKPGDLETRIQANESFIDNAERTLKKVKDPSRREAIEQAIQEARRQVKVATQEKTRPIIEQFKVIEPGKEVPARITSKELARIKEDAAKSKEKVNVKGKQIPIRELATKRLSQLKTTFKVAVEDLVDAVSKMPIKQRGILIAVNPDIASRVIGGEKPYVVGKEREITKPEEVPAFQPKEKPDVKEKILVAPKEAQKIAELTKPQVQPEPETRQKAQPKEKLQTKTKTQPLPMPEPFPQPKLKPILLTKKKQKEVPRIPLSLGSKNDDERREVIKQSDGAVAWKQGKLHGRVWQVGIYPFDKNEYWTTVIGKKPQGATIVDGPRSAYQTIKLLTGKPPDRKIFGDMGIMDITLEPEGKNIIGIGFKPDPKGLTTGDFSIGGRTPRISPKMPKLR